MQNFDPRADLDHGNCLFSDAKNGSFVNIESLHRAISEFAKFKTYAVLANDTNVLLGRDPSRVPDAGLPCHFDDACLSGVCSNGVCMAPSCFDGVLNYGFETDVDCGGSLCPQKCEAGALCFRDLDCDFGGSCVNGTCEVPRGSPCAFDLHCFTRHCDPKSLACTHIKSCFNQIQDQNETDVDCGGKDCPSCPIGADCLLDSDCESDECLSYTCVKPTPTPTPSSSVSPTPSLSPSTTTTATEGTSPTPTASVTSTLTPSGTGSRSPGPSIQLRFHSPNFPLYHDGIFGSRTFVIMALFNRKIQNAHLGPNDFSTTCISIDKDSWIEIRGNLTFSFTARIVEHCPKDATLSLPLFKAGPTHDLSEELVSRFTGDISPTPTSSPFETPSYTPTSSYTGTPSPSHPPLAIRLFALKSTDDLRLNFDPLAFLLQSSHYLQNLRPSVFQISVDGSSTGEERVHSVSKIDNQNAWLVKAEHLRTGFVTVRLPAGSVQDTRGVWLTETVEASVWYDSIAPTLLEIITPINEGYGWKEPSIDILLRLSKGVNHTLSTYGKDKARLLSHAQLPYNFTNAKLIWFEPIFSSSSFPKYADGTNVDIDQRLVQPISDKTFPDFTVFHARVNVSSTLEDTVILEFLPPLFEDRAGNRMAKPRTFFFVRDIMPPILSVALSQFDYPEMTIKLLGHEKFSFVNNSRIEYRALRNTIECENAPAFDAVETGTLMARPFLTEHLFRVVIPRSGIDALGFYVGTEATRDWLDNRNQEGVCRTPFNFSKWPLRFFGNEENVDMFILMNIRLNQTAIDRIAFPVLPTFIEAVAGSSNLLASANIVVRTISEEVNVYGAFLDLWLLHREEHGRLLRVLEEGGTERTKGEIEQQLVAELTAALPLRLFEEGIVNQTEFVTIETVEAVGFPSSIGAAADEESVTEMIASTTAASVFFFIVVAIIISVIWVKRRKAAKRREQYARESNAGFVSPAAMVSRVIDDAAPVTAGNEHGSALKDTQAEDFSESDELEDKDFECNLREYIVDEPNQRRRALSQPALPATTSRSNPRRVAAWDDTHET